MKFSVKAWDGGCFDALSQADAKLVPISLRRRLSPLGRECLGAVLTLPDLEKARYVFSSRHGDFARTLSVLNSLACDEALSPTDFSMSVHHALISLLSIFKKNRRGHSAVSCGRDSFAFGFVEALACLHEKPEEPVLYVYCNAVLPPPYDHFNSPNDVSVVVAMVIVAGDDYSFSYQAADCDENEKSCVPVNFLEFLKGNKRSCEASDGRRLWYWERHGNL